MNFPITRHYQRYEYVVEKGWTNGKDIVDIGSDNGYGLYILSGNAKSVVGIDPALNRVLDGKNILVGAPVIDSKGERVSMIPAKFEEVDFDRPVDIVTAIEVLEHVPNPSEFCKRIAEKCSNAFFTTPLAEKTGPTGNADHVAEYSYEDFRNILEENFEVLEFVFQLSDLSIVQYAHFSGESRVVTHVVQMAWCKSKR